MGPRDLHAPLPGLPRRPGEPGDAAVVLDPEQDVPALEIEQRGHFFGQTLGAQVVALEVDARILAVGDQCGQFGVVHPPNLTGTRVGRTSAVRERPGWFP